MSSSASSGTLTLAQILADLSSLQNTDDGAAHALLSANKAVASSRISRGGSRQHSSRNRPRSEALAFSRMNSSMSVNSTGSSGSITPLDGSPDIKDDDLRRAVELAQLYEMRAKLRKIGDSGLTRAKDRVSAVVEQYARKDPE